MVRLEKLLKRTLAPAALCALAVSACGSQQPTSTAATTSTATATTPGTSNDTVWIYSSLPSAGPDRAEATEIRNGIAVALQPALAAKSFHGFHVRYRELNDSFIRRVSHRHGATSPSTGDKTHSGSTITTAGNTDGWNATATAENAHIAASNPETIAYIGDLNSGATEISLPILNQAGILQITPGSGYAGLTNNYKDITLASEPDRYYPQQRTRTLLRLIPNDVIEASAALGVLHGTGCQHVAAWAFGPSSQETTALLAAVMLTAPRYGMRYYKTPAPAPGPKQPANAPSAYYGFIHALTPDALRCAVVVGAVTPAAVAFTAELRLLSPIPVMGTDGFCNSAWARIPSTIAKAEARNVVAGYYCTTPALPLGQYEGHVRFLRAFRARYHRQPDAYAYYGYVAAQMVLGGLADTGRDQDNREQLVLGLIDGFASDATGAFSFDGDGNVRTNGLGAIAGYGIDTFARGRPVFHRLVNPVTYLLSSG